ncbi:pollen-specific leucine-rich repeat extensin-like protein 1-like, partial [Trifolium pratense]
MKLKVDLQCDKCYKQVKKLLCKFPQIRDQVYDEKNNIVTITVVCCNPEKIRDKICCKGCGAIKSIEILEPPPPPKPKEPEKPKEPVKPKEPEKPKE